MTRIQTLLGVTASVLLASAACGGFAPVDDPFDGGSWGQQFNESGVGSYDLVSVRMVTSGDYFESPTHRSFSQSGWSTSLEKTDGTGVVLATAQGLGVSNMNWNIWFAGAKSDPLTFDFVAFRGNTLVESAHAVWDGSWHITSGSWNPSRSAVVPVPGAVMLGVLGLGGIASVRRRVC